MFTDIKWYEDDDLTIVFSDTPRVAVRYVKPNMTEQEKEDIKQKPFINKKEFNVYLYDHVKGQKHVFVIPKDYKYDGASIPKVFYRIIGANTDNNFLIASLIHDVLCENKNYIKNNRGLSTNTFNALLKVAGVNNFKRFFMKNSVAFYQTIFCRW